MSGSRGHPSLIVFRPLKSSRAQVASGQTSVFAGRFLDTPRPLISEIRKDMPGTLNSELPEAVTNLIPPTAFPCNSAIQSRFTLAPRLPHS